jgi:hypothetical protein
MHAMYPSLGIAAVVSCALLAVAPRLVAAQSINDTGAVRCVDAAGQWLSTCFGTGQDGAYGRDFKRNKASDGDAGFRFTKVCNSGVLAGPSSCSKHAVIGYGPNDWGCTYDYVSGLTWEMKTTDGSDRDAGRSYTWGVSPPFGDGDFLPILASVNSERLCSYDDWRVPTFNELMTIQHYGRGPAAPMTDERFFPNTLIDTRYWSASVFTRDGTYKVLVGFNGQDYYGPTLTPSHLRLVRGSNPLDESRFEPSPDGTEIYDHKAKLAWRACPEGQSIIDGLCTGDYLAMTWQQALDRAKAAGRKWRLPNIAELSSLLASGNGSPCMMGVGPPFPYANYWSNTPATDDAGANYGIWYFARQSSCKRAVALSSELLEVRLVRPL